jgi:hypothetical protein
LTSPFGVIAQMWLALFLESLQMVSEPPSNAKSCGTGALHDMHGPDEDVRGLRGGVCNTPVPYWEEMNSSQSE